MESLIGTAPIEVVNSDQHKESLTESAETYRRFHDILQDPKYATEGTEDDFSKSGVDFLLPDRVMHINTKNGPDQRWRIIVGEYRDSKRVSNNFSRSWHNVGGKSIPVECHNYGYDESKFIVYMTDGITINKLEVATVSGYYEGHVDSKRGGAWESLKIVCLDPQYSDDGYSDGHWIIINFDKEKGTGSLRYDDPDLIDIEQSEMAWILPESDSAPIRERAMKVLQHTQAMGHTAIEQAGFARAA